MGFDVRLSHLACQQEEAYGILAYEEPFLGRTFRGTSNFLRYEKQLLPTALLIHKRGVITAVMYTWYVDTSRALVRLY